MFTNVNYREVDKPQFFFLHSRFGTSHKFEAVIIKGGIILKR